MAQSNPQLAMQAERSGWARIARYRMPVAICVAAGLLLFEFWSCLRAAMREHIVQQLCNAAHTGDVVKVQEMLARHPGIANACGPYGRKPLAWTLDWPEAPKIEIVKALVDASADVNDRDSLPLHVAVQRSHIEAVRLLLAHGADANARNNNGETGLHVAAHWGDDETVRLLLEKRADINTRDNNGRTPLHDTAIEQSIPKARMLLEKGADISARDNGGRTAADLAGGGDYVHFLREHGAKTR